MLDHLPTKPTKSMIKEATVSKDPLVHLDLSIIAEIMTYMLYPQLLLLRLVSKSWRLYLTHPATERSWRISRFSMAVSIPPPPDGVSEWRWGYYVCGKRKCLVCGTAVHKISSSYIHLIVTCSADCLDRFLKANCTRPTGDIERFAAASLQHIPEYFRREGAGRVAGCDKLYIKTELAARLESLKVTRPLRRITKRMIQDQTSALVTRSEGLRANNDEYRKWINRYETRRTRVLEVNEHYITRYFKSSGIPFAILLALPRIMEFNHFLADSLCLLTRPENQTNGEELIKTLSGTVQAYAEVWARLEKLQGKVKVAKVFLRGRCTDGQSGQIDEGGCIQIGKWSLNEAILHLEAMHGVRAPDLRDIIRVSRSAA